MGAVRGVGYGCPVKQERPRRDPPAPSPPRSSPSVQDFAKRQLLIVLEHGDCDAGSCLHAISVSLGDTLVQLRDSGSPSSQGSCLPGLPHPTALRSGLLPAPLSPWTPLLSSTFWPHCPVVPEPKFSSYTPTTEVTVSAFPSLYHLLPAPS